MGTTPVSLLAERARKDSLFARLERAGLLGDFFSWFYAERPSEEETLAWLEQRQCKSSAGAVANMVLKHGLAYRLGEAEMASNTVDGAMPEDAEERARRAVKAKVFELTLSNLGQKEVLALERMNRQSAFEREKLRFDRQKLALSVRLKRADQRLSERRVKLLEKKAAEAAAAANDSTLSDAQKAQRIREIFKRE